MNILYVGYFLPRWGGASISCTKLMERLAGRSCRIRAIAVGSQDPPWPYTACLPPPSIPVICAALPVSDTSPGDKPGPKDREAEQRILLAEVERAVRMERPDLIFIGIEYCIHTVAPLARSFGIPCVARLAGGYTNRIIHGLQTKELADEWLGNLRGLDRVFCLTEVMRAELARLGIERLRVAPNGLDFDEAAPASPNPELRKRLGIPAGARVILHASSLKPVKRPLDLVPAFRLVLEAAPDCRLLVAGDGPLAGELRSAVAEAGLADRTHFAGWVPIQEMRDCYSLADVVVMSSEMEGQARVYLEAQACGKLLISSDIPAARSVVEHGKTGLLYRMGDSADMADKITMALTASNGREAMIATALEQVRSRHAIDVVARQYHQELQAVVGGRVELSQ